MKKVHIRAHHLGLVFKDGELEDVLTEGKYTLWGKTVEVHDMLQPLKAVVDIERLILNPEFAAFVIEMKVADDELLLISEHENFRYVLGPGRHFFWKEMKQYTFKKVNNAGLEIDSALPLSVLNHALMASKVRKYKVEVYEKGLLYVDGTFHKILEPGNYYWWQNAVLIDVTKLDMRQKMIEIGGQEILTKDKAQLRINFTAQYQVTDIVKAIGENKEYEKQLHVLLQLALRAYTAQLSFDEIMERKEQIAAFVLQDIADAAKALGVVVSHCGVKDIILSGELRAIMNQVLIAEKKAQANMITRREETASTRSLMNTAKLMEENQTLWKLKEMEFVEKIAEKINSISLSGGGNIANQLKEIFVR